MTITAEVAETVPAGTRVADVAALAWQGGILTIDLDSTPVRLGLRFKNPVGYRALEEGDLPEFWRSCNLRAGYLHRIGSGGWKDLEATRDGFLSGSDQGLAEWMVVTENTCVSVIGHKPPEVLHAT